MLQNLGLYASFKNVLFVFDNGTDTDLATYEYELYEEDQITDPNTTPYSLIENAVTLVSGRSNSSVLSIPVSGSYIDINNVEQQKNYYGRVRAVDTSGNLGQWTPLEKTDQSTPLIDEQYIVSLTADRIKAGEIESSEIILGRSGSGTNDY